MKILFLHHNFPGQYKYLAAEMAKDPNNQVVFVTKKTKNKLPNVEVIEYSVAREASQETQRYIIGFERAIYQGQEVWRTCNQLKQQGFVPDVICAHPGWGDALFMKDLFPDTPILSFFEFYYHAYGADMNFYPGEESPPDDLARVRVKNTTNLLNLDTCDWGISPTHWQKSVHPEEFHSKISVLHDGVDTNIVKPAAEKKSLTLADGTVIGKDDKVVTYVARNFEPYRGFPIVMRALEIINREHPDAHILVVGNDGVSYGKKEAGVSYLQQMLKEVKFDEKKVHFLGPLPYDAYLKVLQHSTVHIYLTVPFVLSWSMIEAMSAGCLVVGSDTQPVKEVIREGENGLLCDFFSPEDVARRVSEVLNHPDHMQEIKNRARETVEKYYSLEKLMPFHVGLVKDLAGGHLPPPTAKEIDALYEGIDLQHLFRKNDVKKTEEEDKKASA